MRIRNRSLRLTDPGTSTADPLELVTDLSRSRAGGHVSRVSLPIPENLARSGPGSVLGAFCVLLYRYTGQSRLLFDVDLAGGTAGALMIAVDPALPVAELVEVARDVVPGGPALGTPVRFADHAAEPEPGFDLAVSVSGTTLHLDYRVGLFERDSVTRLGAHLTRALGFLVAHPETAVRMVELLDEDERQLVLRQFNDTSRPYPADLPVHRVFEEQARRAPDALAVSAQRGQLTYRELDERSDRLARRLCAAGVRVGDPVALRTSRTPDLAVAALAILKAGGAYLPVEPNYPPEQVTFMLADSDARAMVTVSTLPVDFDFDGVMFYVDTPGDCGPGPLNVGEASADDIAYICYTSGTTGRPKGVRVTHRNVVRLVRGPDYVEFGPGMRTMPSGSIAFDATTFEVWGPLLNGGSLHLVDTDVILSARMLGAEVAARGITTMWLTSPLFNQLVEQDPSAFRPLRELVVGGDALSSTHVAKAMAACPDLVLINGYGPTENTTFSMTHRLSNADLARIPIGRPLANSTGYVLDADGQPCPVGMPGELCLGGDGVALGYLNRPELTAEKFVPDPFVPDGRMYRSGDLARWRPDGVLELLGRRDHQVKVRGFRVEPGEVESALLSYPAIGESIVVARPRPGGDKYLCAYFVAHHLVDPDELRTHLARLLPEHMVPAYLIELPELPLNTSGKVDRGALPDPDGPPLTSVEQVRPRDEVERVLVELAERALGMTGVGVRHGLRDLGADSLTATLIAAGVEARLGKRVPVSAVLRSGTLAALADHVRTSGSAAQPMIPVAPAAASYPLTPQQRQLYFEQFKDPTAVHYNVPVTLDLPRGTGVERLATALRELTAQHDALRTRFVLDGDEVRQVVEQEVALPLLVADGPAPPVRRFVRPFDLARAPLWRAQVHRTDEHVRLRMDLHHIITDGFSLVSMFEDLAARYAGQAIAPPPVQYRDYATWLAGPAGAELRARQEPFWRDVFAAPRAHADLPVDFARAAMRSLDGDVVEFDLDRQRAINLRSLARRHEVTLFAVLAAVHGVLLAGLTGAPDVVVGTPVSGRTTPGLDRTLGMVANTVCLRLDADPALPFGEFLRRVGRTAEDAFAHQDLPFEDVVALAAPRRNYRRTPLFDALIALHSGRYLHVDLAGTRVPLRLEPTGQSPFDLNMQIYELAGALRVNWHYSSALLRRSTAEAWRDTFVNLVDTLLADPDMPVGRLSLAAAPTSVFGFAL